MQAPSSLKDVLIRLVTLFALNRLEADLAWLLGEGIVSIAFARDVPVQVRCAAIVAIKLAIAGHRRIAAMDESVSLRNLRLLRACFAFMINLLLKAIMHLLLE